MNDDDFPPGALAAWQRVQQELLGSAQFGDGWPAASLRALRLVEVHREAAGHLYIIAAPPDAQAWTERLLLRFHRELRRFAPADYCNLALAPEPLDALDPEPEELEEPPPELEAESDLERDEGSEDAPEMESDLEAHVWEVIQEGQASAVARVKLRPTFRNREGGEPWRWFATSTYEQVFWAAYLGRAFPLWQVLRAYDEAALPWPSDRDLSEILAGPGKRDSRSGLVPLLERLREERLAFWQDDPVAGRTYIVAHEAPMLTRFQVERLSKALQDAHRDRWLKPRRLLRAWQRAPEQTFVPYLQVDDKTLALHRRAASQ